MKRKACITIVKVGSNDRPAGPADIKLVEKELKKARKESRCPVLHHDIDVQYFYPNEAIICVGNNDMPAGYEEIRDVAKIVRKAEKKARRGKSSTLVLHHAVDLRSWGF